MTAPLIRTCQARLATAHAFDRRLLAALVAVLLPAATPSVVEGQYFGRNKINYEQFDFRVLESPHFDVYFYPAESLAAVDGARMAERWYTRLSPFLRHNLTRRSFIFYADQGDFQQNNITDIESEGTGGVTEGFRERVILPFTGVAADDDHVIGHELVHVFQYDIAKNPLPTPASGPGGPGGATTPRARSLGLNSLPLWLVEGMAEYLSIGRVDANTAMWLRDAARRDDIPTIRKLTTDPRYFPYRYGQALWAYVGGRFGDEAVVSVFRTSLVVGFEPAIKRVLGITHEQLSKDWAQSIKDAYLPLLAGRTPPESTATRVVFQRAKRGGEYNTSPVVSPDGRHVAFFSSRNLFGIELYIADATTGRVIKELGTINTPRHYDALSFINSAGSWSPDGKRLAYVVYRDGDQVLETYDIETRRAQRQINPRGVGAALDPAWSPDGRYLAFAGSAGGISDLYLYDFETGRLEQLTTGRHAEIQPQWSPDGRSLVFATDRGESSDLRTLSFGPMRLATIDVATRQIALLPALGAGKHINPHFAPDGRSVYFVGDPDGVPDVYRLDTGNGTFHRVTRVASGVSGISELSPALSVARGTGRVVFSVFDRQGYDILRLEASEAQGTPVEGGIIADVASALPPTPPREESIVMAYRRDAVTGLPPADTAYRYSAYRAKFGLDYIAPPSVGASFGGPFGTQLGGGVAAMFGDQMGHNNLVTVLQLQGELRDAGAQAIYQNTRRRWDYGGAIARVPYLTGFAFYEDAGGGAAIYNEVYQRIYIDQAAGFVQYPFSTTRRVEFAVTGTRQSYSVDLRRFLIDPAGRVVDQTEEKGDAPDAVTYAQGSAAYVGDYSFFGLTSPVAGGRYRFEVSPTVGVLSFTTTLADYRRYLLARPVTFAARGLYYARYGKDAEDETRLYPLFIGNPALVRGYDVNNFSTAECLNSTSISGCPAFNRLSGSRIAVAGAEVRVPLLGPEGFGLITTRFIPVELAPFVDAGLAWQSDAKPELRFLRGEAARNSTARVPVVSTGVAMRVNLFGYAIGEVYYAYPFQRPDKGAHFGFQLAPGW